MKSPNYYAKLLAWTALLWFFSGFLNEAGAKTLDVVWETVVGQRPAQLPVPIALRDRCPSQLAVSLPISAKVQRPQYSSRRALFMDDQINRQESAQRSEFRVR
ncbi:hypothetical protein ACC684_29975 [Rhizobium ruizarguesonis]|uniref:Uncharacterized protein n=1 Tax=Rhizobium ruizarguesonis TaxID=2081791 RepID=A0AB38HU68_9HYPH|nr:hypothetical protein [Rhizobium ruizarguesonis]NKK61882.1 hypothetical protein [Rhizobium leguminosarum bv. viciae]TBA13883.1 hypothetical protein ELH61_28195 [Rhizobium ruizarguesonis]TBB58514.1 hypothetical protein ELH42_30305 [Rhizobium ruizarguesonis]TBB60457.1 hypothetical protein ELH45_34580 [Rhizobium ruizarguesonis]TBB83514.1 hypothetical protein ELH39_32135 [Rhizobium ruizarguesonis]